MLINDIYHRESKWFPDNLHHDGKSSLVKEHNKTALPYPEQYTRRTNVEGYVFTNSCSTENITTPLEISYLHEFSTHVEDEARRRHVDLHRHLGYRVMCPAVVVHDNEQGNSQSL